MVSARSVHPEVVHVAHHAAEQQELATGTRLHPSGEWACRRVQQRPVVRLGVGDGGNRVGRGGGIERERDGAPALFPLRACLALAEAFEGSMKISRRPREVS